MKRKISLILSCLFLALVLMFPVSANAATTYRASIGTKKYTTLQKAVDAVKDGQTIKVLRNYKTSKTVTIDKKGVSFTIDFNDKEHTYTGDDTAFSVNAGTVTVKNVTLKSNMRAFYIKSGAKLKVTNGTYSGYWYNKGSLSITKGTFNTKDTGKSSTDELIRNYKTLTISGGRFSATKDNLLENCKNGKATIKGGTFKSTSSKYPLIKSVDASTLKISKGTFKAKNMALDNYGNASITGGSFLSTANNTVENSGTMTIEGGKFDVDSTNNIYSDTLVNYYYLFIYDGNFYGSLANRVEDYGYTQIYGGTFRNYSDLLLNYYGNMYIDGGDFIAENADTLINFDFVRITGGNLSSRPSKSAPWRYSAIVNNGAYKEAGLEIYGGSISAYETYAIDCLENTWTSIYDGKITSTDYPYVINARTGSAVDCQVKSIRKKIHWPEDAVG